MPIGSARRKNLIGARFNNLVVVKFISVNKNGDSIWRFLCNCGNYITTTATLVKRGHIKGCGCLRGERHGASYSTEYSIWHTMIQRCENPNTENYKYYGGRKIKVCRRWRNSFLNFLSDMGKRPIGKTLDRKNNYKGYYPFNCKWSTFKEQRANQRKRVIKKYVARKFV